MENKDTLWDNSFDFFTYSMENQLLGTIYKFSSSWIWLRSFTQVVFP